MKLRALLALGAMILGVGFFGASPAIAAVTEVETTVNNIKCYQRVGGTYPENGLFWYCRDLAIAETHPDHGIAVVNRAKGVNGQKGGFYATKGVKFAVHQSVITWAKYNNFSPTTAYNDHLNHDSFYDPNNNVVVVFERRASGTYPQTTDVFSFEDHNTRHEMGHAYDHLKVPGSLRSAQAQFDDLANKDRAYMIATDPMAGVYLTQYEYWLVKHPTKGWSELFAEHWARASGSSAKPVDQILNSYWACSYAYVQRYFINDKAPTNLQVPTRCRPSNP